MEKSISESLEFGHCPTPEEQGSLDENQPRIINDEIIELNVGGEVFITTRKTLNRYPESTLAVMINSNINTLKVDGAYFVDMEPDLFQLVIAHYRNYGDIEHLIDESDNIQRIKKYFDYFGLDNSIIKQRESEWDLFKNRIIELENRLDEISKPARHRSRRKLSYNIYSRKSP